jgi:putative ATP-binding cassette transporter
MEPELFTPSIDWASAPVDSLIWVAKAWAISAVCTVAVLVVLRYATAWGRQYWRITHGYFVGRQAIPVWLMLGVLLLSVVLGVRLDVLFSYYGNDLYTSLQTAFEGTAAGDAAVRESGIHGFWVAIVTFCSMAGLHVIRIMTDIYLMQRFIIRWRVWLTGQLTDNWLDGQAYYRGRFIDATIDNPDQRIQQDIDVFTAGVGGTPNEPANGTSSVLLFGAINAVVSVISFAAILWHLSGPLTLGGFNIPKAMFWVVILYVLIATVVAFWIGHPLIRYSFSNEKLNAAFRYALVRLRDAAEAVGFYRGEKAERVQLQSRFTPIIDNYRRYVRRTVAFWGWNVSMSQVINPLPWVVQAPRLFAGDIKFGDVGQTASAFGNIHDSLSFFRNSYDKFASFRAAIIRLYGLVDANDRARHLPTITTVDSQGDFVELDDIEVRTPVGEQLISPLDLRLDAGDGLVVTGRSGTGKTTLLRSLAELWPFATGTLRRPGDQDDTMFLSQLPYVPLGNLRAVVSYPRAEGEIPDGQLQEILVKVALPHLVDRLDEVLDWAKVLSPGEQQRVAFARILLTKPKAVFLDEATSALDEGLEMTLYQLLRRELPDTIVVSVSHRAAVNRFHEKQLALLGEGEWRLGPVEKEPQPV